MADDTDYDIDSDAPGRRRWLRWALPLGTLVLLAGGIAVVLLVGQRTRPELPQQPTDPENLPRTPTELLRELTSATAAGNRARLVRLLTDDWVAFVAWADDRTQKLADAKKKAAEAIRAAIGDEPAKLVQGLPDVPAAWPLFAGVDWSAATIPDPNLPVNAEIVTATATFIAQRVPDGTWRLRPGSQESVEDMKQDIAAALGPPFATYTQLEAMARAGLLSAESFPAVVDSVRQLALVAMHPPAPPPPSPPSPPPR